MNDEICDSDNSQTAAIEKSHNYRIHDDGYLTLYDVVPDNCVDTKSEEPNPTYECRTTADFSTGCSSAAYTHLQNVSNCSAEENCLQSAELFETDGYVDFGDSNAGNFSTFYNEMLTERKIATAQSNSLRLRDGAMAASVSSSCSGEAVCDYYYTSTAIGYTMSTAVI